jgi:hypothetical protein
MTINKKKSLTAKQKKEDLQAVLPKSITVLGKQFEVIVTNLKGLHGDCDATKGVIRIHQNCTIEVARSTLFHEAIHAALDVSGQGEMLREDQEEALVRMLEHTFYHIVDINKLGINYDNC